MSRVIGLGGRAEGEDGCERIGDGARRVFVAPAPPMGCPIRTSDLSLRTGLCRVPCRGCAASPRFESSDLQSAEHDRFIKLRTRRFSVGRSSPDTGNYAVEVGRPTNRSGSGCLRRSSASRPAGGALREQNHCNHYLPFTSLAISPAWVH